MLIPNATSLKTKVPLWESFISDWAILQPRRLTRSHQKRISARVSDVSVSYRCVTQHSRSHHFSVVTWSKPKLQYIPRFLHLSQVVMASFGTQGPRATDCVTKVAISISCENLLDMDTFSKSDPMCVLLMNSSGPHWCEVGRSIDLVVFLTFLQTFISFFK